MDFAPNQLVDVDFYAEPRKSLCISLFIFILLLFIISEMNAKSTTWKPESPLWAGDNSFLPSYPLWNLRQ